MPTNLINNLFYKTKIIVLIFITLLSFLGLNNISYGADSDKYGYDDISPYVVVDINDQFNPVYYNLPSYINPKNIGYIPSNCNKNDLSERLRYKPSFGTNLLTCNGNIQDTIKSMLVKAKVVNIAQIYGNIITDATSPRYYLISHKFKITQNDVDTGKLYIDGDDIIYNDTNTDIHLMYVFDPDMKKGTYEQLFTQSNLQHNPSLTFSAYNIDSGRITDNLIGSGVYTMEHYLGDKYTSNNGSTLKTTSYDNLELYKLTYYQQPFIGIADWTRYCNARNLTSNDYFDLYYGNDLVPFQSTETVGTTSSSPKIETNRDLAGPEKTGCDGASGLRINKSIGNNLPNGSIPLKYGIVGNAYNNSIIKNYNGENSYYAPFNPLDSEGEIGELKTSKVGVVGNKRNFDVNRFSDSDILNEMVGTKVKLYFMVKANLLFFNFDLGGTTIDFTDGNCSSEACESHNNFLIGFDPIHTGWNDYNNHKIVTDVNSITESTSSTTYDENSLIYKLLFNGYNNTGGYRYQGEGNLYVAYTKENEIFNMSSPGYVATPEKYSSDSTTQEKMKYRGIHIPLTASQGYIVSETSGTTYNESGDTLSIASRAVINSYGEDLTRFLFARNFDADSGTTTDFNADTNRDENIGYKVFSKNSLNNNISLYQIYTPNDTESYIQGIPGFKTNFDIAENVSNCQSTYNISTLNKVWGILGPNETTTSCGKTAAEKLRLSGNTGNYQQLKFSEGYQQGIEGVIQDLSLNKTSAKGLYINQIFENVNDGDVLNQVFTNSNYLENINDPVIQCNLNFYKVPVKSSSQSDYASWLSSDANLYNVADYATNTDLFETNSNTIVDYDLIDKLVSNTYTLSDMNDYIGFYYGPSRGDYTAGYSDWNVGEKGIATYYCNNLPRDKKVNVIISTDNLLYIREKDSFFKIGNKEYYNFVADSYATSKKLGFNLDNALAYDKNNYNTSNGTLKYLDNYSSGSYESDILMGYYPEATYPNYLPTLGFDTAQVSNKDHVKGAVEFIVNEDTEGKYTEISMYLFDNDNKTIIQSTKHYIRAKSNGTPIQITNVTKYEQSVSTGYDHSEVGFDGVDNTNQYGINIEISNTTASDLTVISGANAGGINKFRISSLTAGLSEGYNIANNVLASCDNDTSNYDCVNDGSDYGNINQESKQIIDKIGTDGSVSIVKTDLNGVKTIFNAIKSNSPIAGNFTYKITTDGTDSSLLIAFPSDNNTLEANTSYQLQLSVPDGSFVGNNFWKGLTSINKNAVGFVPYVEYVDPVTYLSYPWDLSIKTGISPSGFYSKLNILGSSGSCNSLLSDVTNLEYYKVGAGQNVYLSESAAQSNGESCSDASVTCLYDIQGKITKANLGYDRTVNSEGYAKYKYYGMNFLGDDTANIGDKYSLLVQITNNGNTSTGDNASESNLLLNPLSVETQIEFNVDMDVSKGISAISKTSDDDVDLVVSINSGITDKSLSMVDVYGTKSYKFRDYDDGNYKWKSNDLTTTYLDGSNPNLEWGKTSLLAYQTTLPSLLTRTPSSAGILNEDKRYYTGVYGNFTTNKKPSALVTLKFGTENVPVELKNQTCQISVNDFPTIRECLYEPPVMDVLDIQSGKIDDYSADDYDDFINQNSSISNDINTCNAGSPSDTALSIEYQNYKADQDGNLQAGIIYHTEIENNSECGEANYLAENGNGLDVFVDIPDASNIYSKCTANIGDLGIPVENVSLGSNGVYIKDIDLNSGDSKDIYVACSIKEIIPDCASDNITKATVDLIHPFGTITSNNTDFKICMNPIIKIKSPAKVLDGNSLNDKIPEEYSTAYPFEMQECGTLENNWEIEYIGGCGLTDPKYKDFDIIWHKGTSYDDRSAGRDFYQGKIGQPISGVLPNDNGDTIEWDFSSGNLDDIFNSDLDSRVQIYNDPTGEMRGEGSYFEFINNEPSIINVEIETGAGTCTGDICTSKLLSSAIGLDPIVDNQSFTDRGIMENPDDNYAILHKEEIDETSKQGNLAGPGHRENVIFKTLIKNPAKNSFYGLNALEFDLSLGNSANIFDSIDTSEANVGTNLSIKGSDPVWEQQTINAGAEQEYIGHFLLDKTLNSVSNPYVTPAIVGNSTKVGTGQPKLVFGDSSSCNYSLGFNRWRVEIEDNPIIIKDFSFEDIVENPGTSNQHLPGDIINFNIDIANTNTTREFKDVFIDIKFNDNTTLSDPNLEMDLKGLFSVDGSLTAQIDPYYGIQLYEVPLQGVSCGVNSERLICIFNTDMETRKTQHLKIPLRIDISSEFYTKLKNSVIDEKYWYPVIIDSIRYGSPDLNSINHPTKGNIIYYTSDLNTLPSGGTYGDMKNNDINNPNLKTIVASPNDGNYNFYVGIPYVNITNEIVNNSLGHFSPGDILTFKTKVESRSKAYIRDIIFNQDLFKLDLRNDYLNTEILEVSYDSTDNNFNTSTKSVDILALNTNADLTDDINTSGIDIVKISNDGDGLLNYDEQGTNFVLYTDGPGHSYLNGTTDPDNTPGGTIEIVTKLKILGLKASKFPQIGCNASGNTGCERGTNSGENPKKEYQVGFADIPYIGTGRDAEAEDEYLVYFPILKSLLFQKTDDSYNPRPGGNIIKGLINSDTTELVYRVDNFLPTSYDASINGIGKARDAKAHIKLPVGVSYVPNSFKKIDNLKDTFPYGTEVAVSDPVLNSVSEYSVIEATGQHSFDSNFLDTNSGWKKIDKTDTNNFNILKGAPFRFSFYNNSYNNYRVSDDGVIALGYKTGDSSLSEGQYYIDKEHGTIEVKNTSPGIIISVNTITSGVLLPNSTSYQDLTGKTQISNGIDLVSIKANSEVSLNGGDIVKFTKGMRNVEVSNRSDTVKYKTDVTYTNTSFESYKIISPAFIKLDMRDLDNKGHGVYEKQILDGSGNTLGLAYQWYGYVEGTTKEVQYGIILYTSLNYNSVKFTYGNIDTTLNIPVISGISDSLNVLYSPKNLDLLQDLNNSNDIFFDASSIYQELVFDIGYDANPLDVITTDLIDYEERTTTAPYSFIDKPKSSVAVKFNVNIRSDEEICQREYTESLGGSTLKWSRRTSSQVDADDIDTFCFAAEKPGIAILENASYAKGGYKTGQSSCVVQHLSIMGFNAVSVGWNTNTNNNCWLTYNTKVKEKELSLDTTSPYLILSDFSDKVDTRPIDTNEIITNQNIIFDTPSSINIIDGAGSHDINTLIPDFASKGLIYATKNNIYLYGYSSNNNKSYLIYSNNNGETWKVIQEFGGKRIDLVYILNSNIEIFFTDGTYSRNTEGGIGEWINGVLVNYSNINEVRYRTNTSGFIVGNNGTFWKTNNSGRTWEYFNFKDTYNLQVGENLNSIDIYGSNEIWISTNKGNILYSNNSGETFVKTSTGSTPEVILTGFEDDDLLFSNNIRNNIVGTKDSNIDITNNKSIKFNNINQYEYNGMIISKSRTKTIDYTSINTDLSNYLKDVNGKKIPLGDLDLEVYVSDKVNTGNIYKLHLIDNYGNKLILDIRKNIKDGTIETLSNGFMKTHFELRDENGSDYYFNIVNNNSDNFKNISQYYIETDKDYISTNQDFVGLSDINFASIDNLSNIQDINDFSATGDPSNYIRTGFSSNILELMNGSFSLNDFVKSGNLLKGYLLIDVYVENPDSDFFSTIELGNDNSKKIVWNSVDMFISGGNITAGWNTLILPFDDTNSNITYIGKENISWGNLTYFKIGKTNNSISNQSYAIDSFRYTDSESTNFKYIKFFNSKDGITFDKDKSYITNNNSNWGVNKTFKGDSSIFEFIEMKKIRGREVYGLINTDTGWASYYSLDKGINAKVHLSESGVNLKYFDILDYDLGIALSENNKLYRMSLTSGL